MRNWTLTPAILLSLGATLHAAAPRSSVAPGQEEHRQGLDLAGSVVVVRQLGPLHPHDADAGFVLSTVDGPRPALVSTWVGEQRRPHDAALLIPGQAPLVVRLDLPLADRLAEAHLWVEIEQGWGARARGAFALQRG